MCAMVDPNDKKFADKGKIQPVGSGEGDFVAVGFEPFIINGKAVIEVRSICIQSANSSNEGGELRDLFFLHNEGAISRFVKFAKDGCGWTEPFDPMNPEYVAKIIGNRPFRAKVVATPNGEHVKHECGWNYSAPKLEYDQATGKYLLTEPMRVILAAGAKAWEGYCKWRHDNPRDVKTGGGSGSGSGRGASGGSGGSGGSAGGRGGGGGSGVYDDIPF